MTGPLISCAIKFIAEFLSAYVTADFLVGMFHWLKDTYFTPHTPIIGRSIIWPSRLHHIKPSYVTEFSDIDLAKSSGLWTLLWMGPLFYFCGFSVFNVVLFIFITVNDVIHKYAHVLESKRIPAIIFLHNAQIIQGHDEHHQHHMLPYINNYCPITPYLNIILEKIDFWRRLEDIIEKKTGYKPRATEDKFIENNDYPAGIQFIP